MDLFLSYVFVIVANKKEIHFKVYLFYTSKQKCVCFLLASLGARVSLLASSASVSYASVSLAARIYSYAACVSLLACCLLALLVAA
jgi:hypothetical protein